MKNSNTLRNIMIPAKVLVIHCGGTLGMINSKDGFKTKKNYLAMLIKSNKTLNSVDGDITDMKVENEVLGNGEKNISCCGKVGIVTEQADDSTFVDNVNDNQVDIKKVKNVDNDIKDSIVIQNGDENVDRNLSNNDSNHLKNNDNDAMRKLIKSNKKESVFDKPKCSIEKDLDCDLHKMSIYLNDDSKPFAGDHTVASRHDRIKKNKKNDCHCEDDVHKMLNNSSDDSNVFCAKSSCKRLIDDGISDVQPIIRATGSSTSISQSSNNKRIKSEAFDYFKKKKTSNQKDCSDEKVHCYSIQNDKENHGDQMNCCSNFAKIEDTTVKKDNTQNYENEADNQIIKSNSNFSNDEYISDNDEDLPASNEIDYATYEFKKSTFRTKVLLRKKSIQYDLIELPHIIDSSIATLQDWSNILKIVHRFYNDYRGFVLIHGTDTMSYATSFFCAFTKNLCKPIIFTGSMMPMSVEKHEAQTNLVNSLILANCLNKGCVYLSFCKHIYNGNCVTKFSSRSKDAFYSAKRKNCMEAIAERNLYVHKNTEFFYSFCSKIAILKIYPGITADMVRGILDNSKGVVLETFGSGNGLSNNANLLKLFEEFIKKGGVIVNISQCNDGYVDGSYEANSALSKVGVVCGYDKTTEMAFCKLARKLAD